jgi:hypothetical protein
MSLSAMRTARTFDGVDYTPGRRFRPAREGLRLQGLIPDGRSAYRGWAQDLRLEDILTCTGFGPGFGGDPGFGVEFTTERSREERAFHCDLRPQWGTLWSYRPCPGDLEAVL